MNFRSFVLLLPLVAAGIMPVRADGAVASQRGVASNSETSTSQQSQRITLVPNALSNSALWAGLADKDALDKGKGSWRLTNEKTMMVRGSIATPLDIGSLQDATIQASLRFKVPQNCADYTSVALTLTDANGQPFYAVVIFKNPGTPVGQAVGEKFHEKIIF